MDLKEDAPLLQPKLEHGHAPGTDTTCLDNSAEAVPELFLVAPPSRARPMVPPGPMSHDQGKVTRTEKPSTRAASSLEAQFCLLDTALRFK